LGGKCDLIRSPLMLFFGVIGFISLRLFYDIGGIVIKVLVCPWHLFLSFSPCNLYKFISQFLYVPCL
jgi:hypothetical protein